MELENKHIKKMDEEIMSQVFYDYICEEMGESTVDGILQYLNLDKSNLYDQDIQKRLIYLIELSHGSL